MEVWVSDFCRVADNGCILDKVYQIDNSSSASSRPAAKMLSRQFGRSFSALYIGMMMLSAGCFINIPWCLTSDVWLIMDAY